MKNKAWSYATAFVVILILFNPEMSLLALFIDAIGLEIFIMLLQVQVISMLALVYQSKIKPLLQQLKRFYSMALVLFTYKNSELKSGSYLVVIPSQALIMHLLVLSAALGMVYNTN